jgi:MTH538 TIR-like domain (DUF1863)
MSHPPTHGTPPRLSKLFVSYHHDRDGYFYEEFCRLVEGFYRPVQDDSVERRTGWVDAEHVTDNLRKYYLADAICTVVLCGARTPLRRFVDWEIKASLDLSRGLVAVILPENLPDARGRYGFPPRLADNLASGYAECLHLVQLSGGMKPLAARVEAARSKAAGLMRNSRPLLGQGPGSG